mmetsp:Transcript_13858/g.21120  ORF Transcript_13858/g.21120 Transcript_13858/m.21120 type:complete len:121 (-) Transcript_13858:144-506(-)
MTTRKALQDNVKLTVSFCPFVKVREFIPILDPIIKRNMHYSRLEIRMMQVEAKRLDVRHKLSQQRAKMMQLLQGQRQAIQEIELMRQTCNLNKRKANELAGRCIASKRMRLEGEVVNFPL